MNVMQRAKKISIAPLVFLFGFVWMGAAFQFPYLHWLPSAVHGGLATVSFILLAIANGRADSEMKSLSRTKRFFVTATRLTSGLLIVASLVIAGVYENVSVLLICALFGFILVALDLWIIYRVVGRGTRI